MVASPWARGRRVRHGCGWRLTARTLFATLTLPLGMTGCDGPRPPATLLQQCLGVTEPFASADLGVPLAVFTTGLAANGHLAWHRTGAASWTARWAWTDVDTGERHRTTFDIAELTQDAATTGCGPRIAAISRMTMDGDDLSPMTRDQLVYAMRDRYAADEGVKLGQARPPSPADAARYRAIDEQRERNQRQADANAKGYFEGEALRMEARMRNNGRSDAEPSNQAGATSQINTANPTTDTHEQQ